MKHSVAAAPGICIAPPKVGTNHSKANHNILQIGRGARSVQKGTFGGNTAVASLVEPFAAGRSASNLLRLAAGKSIWEICCWVTCVRLI